MYLPGAGRPEAAREEPVVPRAQGSFEDDKHFFLLTDFYEGGDMKNRLENAEDGRFTPEETRNYCAQIILAMEELHRNHIVHRDLKPANLLLNYQDEVIIADFGLARAFGQIAHDQPSIDTDDTFCPVSSCGTFGALSGKVDQTAQQCGTLSYMAPEVWLGQPYSYGVDVWAFGVIMYEMLHGKLPFDLDEVDESLWSIEDYVDRICGKELRVDDGIEDDAYDALHIILEKDPLKRPSWEQIKKHPWFNGVDWAQLSRRTQAEAPEAPEEDYELDTDLFGTLYAVGEEPHPFFQWTSEDIEPWPLRASSKVTALASSVCSVSLSASTGHPASAPCLAVLAAGISAPEQPATQTLRTCGSGASNQSLQDLYEGDQDEDIDAMDISTRVTSTILLDGDTYPVAWMPHTCFPLEGSLTDLLDDVQLVEEDLDASEDLPSGAIGSFAIVPPSLSPSSALYRTPSMSSSGSHAGSSSYSVSSSRSSAFVDTFYSPPSMSTTDADVFARPVHPEDHPLRMASLPKVRKTAANHPPSLVASLSASHLTSSPCSSLSSLPDSPRATAISDAGEHSTSPSPRPTGRGWFGRLKAWWACLWLTTARPVLL
ncbi:kinase-like domain-containing protein [Trametes elegans]|nr:kinase-like domain-containing protein [Trametes elegans]